MNSTDGGDIEELYDDYVHLIESGIDLSRFVVYCMDRSRFGAAMSEMNAVYRQSIYKYAVQDELNNYSWFKLAMRKAPTGEWRACAGLKLDFVASHISQYTMSDRKILKTRDWENPMTVPPVLLQRTWPKLYIGPTEYYVM